MDGSKPERLWLIKSCIICHAVVCLVLFSYSVDCTDQPIPSTPFLLPTIFWDPRNPVFNCPSKGINTINVRVNDYFRLACPKPGRLVDSHTVLDIPTGEMYENAFMTDNEAQFNQCIADASLPPLMSCNDPVNGNVFRTVRLAMHSGSSSDPLFVPGTTYYLYDTSTGLQSHLNNRAGGRCNASTGPYTFQVKLKLHVCPLAEAGTPKCPICQTAACYIKGCGTYGAWNDMVPKAYYRDITSLRNDSIVAARKSISVVNEENQCFVYRKRICSNSDVGCTGSDTMNVTVPCPTVEVEPLYTNCTALVSTLYRDLNGSCVNVSHHNCTVGSLEKFQVTRWYRNITSCPPTTPPPTATLPTTCLAWSNLTGIYRNGTDRCFRLQSRKCEYCRKNTTHTKVVDAICPIPSSSTASSTSMFSSMQVSSSPCPVPVTLTNTYTLTPPTVTQTVVCSVSSISKSTVSQSLSSTAPSLMNSIMPSSFSVNQSRQVTSQSSEGVSPSSKALLPCSAISPSCSCPTLSSSSTTKAGTTNSTLDCAKSSGNDESSTDYKNYIIPMFSAIFGCFCGAVSVWLYYRRMRKLNVSDEEDGKSNEMTHKTEPANNTQQYVNLDFKKDESESTW